MSNKIIDKIKKLLNLSKSSNEHEAASAAETAARLMMEHQISVASLEEEDDSSNILGHFKMDDNKKKVAWKGDLAFGVAASFGCQYYWSGANPVMFGRTSDVDAVKYTYQYLVREINKLATETWENYRLKEYEKVKEFKNAFRRGAALIVRRRLQQIRQRNMAAEKYHATGDENRQQAIVKVQTKDTEIKNIFDQWAANFGTYKPKQNVASAAGLYYGQLAGERINLSRENKGLGGAANHLKPETKELGDRNDWKRRTKYGSE